MKRLTLAILSAALVLVSGAAIAKEWKIVRIGVEGAYPPFSSVTTSGQLVGFDIDITKALCKEMQVKCSMVQ